MAMRVDELQRPSCVEDWQALVQDYERRGMLLRAYDTAERGVEAFPDDTWLRHRAVLTLARSGATKLAQQRFKYYNFEEDESEEIAALAARLIKDLAWLASGDARKARAAEAAEAYQKIYERTAGYYPAINAATLKLIAGDVAGAKLLAHRILNEIKALPDAQGVEAYYRAATEAEALLLLGDVDATRAALVRAVKAHGEDFAARATSRKQLRRVCDALSLGTDVLDVLVAKKVIHYCGHMISLPGEAGRLLAEGEREVTQRIAEYLDKADPGYAYGSLACGADILFAEALLKRGAELNLVFPFKIEEFLDTSVRRGGAGWEERFRWCLNRAITVDFATEDQYLGEDQLFRYSSQLAMGLARLRARYLDTDVEQVALWDGEPTAGAAGTAADVGLWRSFGFAQEIIPSPGSAPESQHAAAMASCPAKGRVNHAILFGDVKGFSKLEDRQVPIFVREVLGRLADVLKAYNDKVLFRNTWGDAIYLILDDVYSAARCALDLQVAMSQLPLRKLGLPDFIALRLGGHFGPVSLFEDPVLKTYNFFGAHVSKAARIEPITPPGEVYVTDHFASTLALDPKDEFECEYVGEIPMAKDYGNLKMYLLRRMANASYLL
jgi:class 3 adenylate cyclase/tetratricopeptide (TPR) repeat protein